MNNIPAKLREDIAADPYYQCCCVTGALAKDTKVEWHHNLIFAGKQVQEKWAILPLRADIHEAIVRYKEKCDWIMLNRATDDDLRRYSKATNLIARRAKLNEKYGTYRHKAT